MRWPIWFIASAFFIAENAYFGWNLVAQSDAEMICDGIALLMMSISFLAPKGGRV